MARSPAPGFGWKDAEEVYDEDNAQDCDETVGDKGGPNPRQGEGSPEPHLGWTAPWGCAKRSVQPCGTELRACSHRLGSQDSLP